MVRSSSKSGTLRSRARASASSRFCDEMQRPSQAGQITAFWTALPQSLHQPLPHCWQTCSERVWWWFEHRLQGTREWVWAGFGDSVGDALAVWGGASLATGAGAAPGAVEGATEGMASARDAMSSGKTAPQPVQRACRPGTLALSGGTARSFPQRGHWMFMEGPPL